MEEERLARIARRQRARRLWQRNMLADRRNTSQFFTLYQELTDGRAIPGIIVYIEIIAGYLQQAKKYIHGYFYNFTLVAMGQVQSISYSQLGHTRKL